VATKQSIRAACPPRQLLLLELLLLLSLLLLLLLLCAVLWSDACKFLQQLYCYLHLQQDIQQDKGHVSKMQTSMH
jgi:hypothetical protein